MQVNKYLDGSDCSVFCKLEGYQEVSKYLNNSAAANGVSFEVLDEMLGVGAKYRITFLQDTIDFYVLIRNKGGDETSKTILAAYNFVKKIITDRASNQHYIQQHLQACNSSIGIKCSSDFSDLTYGFVISFVKKISGLIMNGSGVLDEEGALVLGFDGAYSVLYEL